MILVVLGTHEQSFKRALDLVLPLARRHAVVIQHGHTPSRPAAEGVRWIRFVPYERLVSLMARADGVVCHAGVGAIMTALETGKVPVALPRLAARGEHVDDHQLQIVDALAERELVVPCLDGNDLAVALESAAALATRRSAGASALADAVARAVEGAGTEQRSTLRRRLARRLVG